MSLDNTAPVKKVNWEKVSLFALLAFGIVFLILILFSLFGGTSPKAQHSTTSDLINTKEIATLSEMPGRIKPVDEEPWHSRGLRKIIAKNFYVYFLIDEPAKRVYILNVIYDQRDQLKQMAKMKT